MKPGRQRRSPDAPDRMYRPDAVAELDRGTAPDRANVTVMHVRSALRRYRLIVRRRFLL